MTDFTQNRRTSGSPESRRSGARAGGFVERHLTVPIVAFGGVIGVIAVLIAAQPAGALNVGTARITAPDGSELSGGGSRTTFAVALPQGAHCPGDTAHKSFLVYSYLVPKGVSPTAVDFHTGVPSRGYGLIADGAYFGASNTAIDTGQIVNVPTRATWSRLTPQDLFPANEKSAVWEGGIACATPDGAVTDYWNIPVTFTASSSDPGGFTWAIGRSSSSEDDGSPTLIIGLVIVVVVAGGAFAFLRFRSRSQRAGALSGSAKS
jgi:hypothetical protein